jgi:hypothetical protein
MSIGIPPRRSIVASHAARAASGPPAHVSSSSEVMMRTVARASPSRLSTAAPMALSTSASPPAYSSREPAATASAVSSTLQRQPTVGSGPRDGADGTEMLDTSGSSFSCDGWLGSHPSHTLPVLWRPPPPPSAVTSMGMVAFEAPEYGYGY